LVSDAVDGGTRFNFEGLQSVASVRVEDGEDLEEGPATAEVLIERIASEGREMDAFKS
jgi:hypothetical protein